MPEVTDLGKQGPHPDVVTDLVEKLGQYPLQGDDVSESDIQIIQQRTLSEVTWSIWTTDRATTKSGNLDVSAGLAVSAPRGARKLLIAYVATRLPDRDNWGIAETGSAWIEDPPRKPWTGCFLGSRGIWIGIGGLAHSPDLGRVRITLADGQAVESTVSDGSFLVLVPCDSAELWSSPATVAYYDTEGREIRTDSYDLSLSSSS
jgi:hypothetical protein